MGRGTVRGTWCVGVKGEVKAADNFGKNNIQKSKKPFTIIRLFSVDLVI